MNVDARILIISCPGRRGHEEPGDSEEDLCYLHEDFVALAKFWCKWCHPQKRRRLSSHSVHSGDLTVHACRGKVKSFLGSSVTGWQIIVYIGHGCPASGSWHLADGSFDIDELFTIWSEVQASTSELPKLFVYSDSCHSGHLCTKAALRGIDCIIQASCGEEEISRHGFTEMWIAVQEQRVSRIDALSNLARARRRSWSQKPVSYAPQSTSIPGILRFEGHGDHIEAEDYWCALRSSIVVESSNNAGDDYEDALQEMLQDVAKFETSWLLQQVFGAWFELHRSKHPTSIELRRFLARSLDKFLNFKAQCSFSRVAELKGIILGASFTIWERCDAAITLGAFESAAPLHTQALAACLLTKLPGALITRIVVALSRRMNRVFASPPHLLRPGVQLHLLEHDLGESFCQYLIGSPDVIKLGEAVYALCHEPDWLVAIFRRRNRNLDKWIHFYTQLQSQEPLQSLKHGEDSVSVELAVAWRRSIQSSLGGFCGSLRTLGEAEYALCHELDRQVAIFQRRSRNLNKWIHFSRQLQSQEPLQSLEHVESDPGETSVLTHPAGHIVTDPRELSVQFVEVSRVELEEGRSKTEMVNAETGEASVSVELAVAWRRFIQSSLGGFCSSLRTEYVQIVSKYLLAIRDGTFNPNGQNFSWDASVIPDSDVDEMVAINTICQYLQSNNIYPNSRAIKSFIHIFGQLLVTATSGSNPGNIAFKLKVLRNFDPGLHTWAHEIAPLIAQTALVFALPPVAPAQNLWLARRWNRNGLFSCYLPNELWLAVAAYLGPAAGQQLWENSLHQLILLTRNSHCMWTEVSHSISRVLFSSLRLLGAFLPTDISGIDILAKYVGAQHIDGLVAEIASLRASTHCGFSSVGSSIHAVLTRSLVLKAIGVDLRLQSRVPVLLVGNFHSHADLVLSKLVSAMLSSATSRSIECLTVHIQDGTECMPRAAESVLLLLLRCNEHALGTQRGDGPLAVLQSFLVDRSCAQMMSIGSLHCSDVSTVELIVEMQQGLSQEMRDAIVFI